MDDLHRALARELTKQRRNARTDRRNRIATIQDRSRMLDEICSAAGVRRTLVGFGWREVVNEINAAILRERSALATARAQIDSMHRAIGCAAPPVVSIEGKETP